MNLEVFVERLHSTNSVRVWVHNSDLAGNIINLTMNNGSLEWKQFSAHEIVSGDGLFPFIEVPMSLAQPLFKALAEWLSGNGVRTKDENMIEGKLLATEKHLESESELTRRLLAIVETIATTTHNK